MYLGRSFQGMLCSLRYEILVEFVGLNSQKQELAHAKVVSKITTQTTRCKMNMVN